MQAPNIKAERAAAKEVGRAVMRTYLGLRPLLNGGKAFAFDPALPTGPETPPLEGLASRFVVVCVLRFFEM